MAILLGVTLIAACSKDDSSDNTIVNENRNVTGGFYCTNNLEFPHLKGGTSKVIVYTATSVDEGKYGMNFAVEWDCNKKSNRWSCYRFDTSNRQTGKRKDGSNVVRWYPNDKSYPGSSYGDKKDPSRTYPFDYKNLADSEMLEDLYYGSGCDHGHLCPSADRLYSQEANIETFFMTNMMPQYSKFNQDGIWIDMENKTRSLARTLTDTDTLYIVKGGTIDSEANILERIQGKLIVPKYYYAAFLMWRPLNGSTDRNSASNYKAMAYWFPHGKSADKSSSLEDIMISIDDLELRTGIDFFCNLPDKVEVKVESTLSKNAW
ncbi:MAG: DNA/RNA non-specific endonuclease [Bacteroidaceae bacterium]|nr:DNA/RNA non-specific endonuclease [Bacteroidaceae bacterium]